MNIHEYQAKGLLAKFGVAVPRGHVAFTPTEAEVAAQKLGGSGWVVKAQIHAGGRGKGGGVKVVKSREEVKTTAERMLGMNLVTHQTGPGGKEVKRVYIEEGCDIARELYLGVLLDRATGRVTMMVSTEGGMDIEEVAAKTPEKIIKVAIDPATGLQPFHAHKLAFGLGLEGPQIRSAVTFLQGMYKAYTELDASLVEINPLVVTGAGELLALDAKMNFDNTMDCSARKRLPTCVTRARKMRQSWRRVNTSSTTSSWMAPLAAWSTARDWLWRPWTSSSSKAAIRPIS